MYLLLAFAYLYTTWSIPTLLHISTINNILTSVSNSNLASVFFKYAWHANSGAKENKHDLVVNFPIIFP